MLNFGTNLEFPEVPVSFILFADEKAVSVAEKKLEHTSRKANNPIVPKL
jgi:hypothetical protein